MVNMIFYCDIATATPQSGYMISNSHFVESVKSLHKEVELAHKVAKSLYRVGGVARTVDGVTGEVAMQRAVTYDTAIH